MLAAHADGVSQQRPLAGKLHAAGAGRYLFEVEAWTDQFATWRHGLILKRDAGQDISVDALEGRDMLEELRPTDATARQVINRVKREFDRDKNVAMLLDDELAEAVAASDPRNDMIRSLSVPVTVDRERARASAWYEFMPRSQSHGARPARHLQRCNRAIARDRRRWASTWCI